MDIKEKAKELCTCHHKCKDTTDCVVEDEALLLINQDKSNNFDVKSNNLPFVLTNEEKVSVKVKQSEGEWIDLYKGKYANPLYSCSVCGKGTLLKPHINELNNMNMVQALSPYCPHCGAKMKGGE